MSQVLAFCPSCQQRYKIDSSLYGRVLKCQACETLFEIEKPPETVPTVPVTPQPVQPQATHVPPPAAPAPGPGPLDPLTVDPLAVDPLATPPPPVARPAAPPARAPGAPAATRPATSGKPESGGIGGRERGMLLMGGFLIIFGLVMNLLPLFGTQVARFQGSGHSGQIVGLLMGLAGTGLLVAGLRHFKMAALISGASSGGLLLLAFLVSLFAGDAPQWDYSPGNPTMAGGDEPELASVSSPWIKAYPRWEGFSSVLRPRPRQGWQRFPTALEGVSGSFPTTTAPLTESNRSLTIDRTGVDVNVLTGELDNQQFSCMTLAAPDPSRSADQILDDVQQALGNVRASSPTRVGRFKAREFEGGRGTRALHGLMVVAGEVVVVFQVEGPRDLVPGDLSSKFVHGLEVDSSVADGGPSSGGDALDPNIFEEPNNPDIQVPTQASGTAVFRPTPQQRNHDNNLKVQMRTIEAAMSEGIGARSESNFPGRYLTVPAGDEVGTSRYLVHPAKAPVVGLDFVVAPAGNDAHLFTTVVPVFDPDRTDCRVKARQGYGLSGMYVNAGRRVKGIKFIFSRVTDRGFDPDTSYETEWFGTPAGGAGQKIDSAGRPVYGLWLTKSNVTNSIGLIREQP